MSASKRSFLSRLLRWLLISAIAAILLFVGYTWLVLTWSYSEGERAGYVQKFSKKGIIVKTWEGELAMVSQPGSVPEKFWFSCRLESVADSINAAMGVRVVLRYEQHVGLPTALFGDTEYFVVGVRRIE
jgi:hypothetical protein